MYPTSFSQSTRILGLQKLWDGGTRYGGPVTPPEPDVFEDGFQESGVGASCGYCPRVPHVDQPGASCGLDAPPAEV